MVQLQTQSPIRVGKFDFLLTSANAELLRVLESVWMSERFYSQTEAAESPGELPLVINVDELLAGEFTQYDQAHVDFAKKDRTLLFELAVDLVRQKMCDSHTGLLYCHGAAFVTPKQKTVMLLGLSFAGKSTLSMALCFKHNWRLIVEDIIYFDEFDQVVAMRNPLSLREPSTALLADYGAPVPDPPIVGWIPPGQIYSPKSVAASFDLVVLLNESAAAGKSFASMKVSPEELLRYALATSNALRSTDGADRLFRFISPAACYFVSGGSLYERCTFLEHSLSE